MTRFSQASALVSLRAAGKMPALQKTLLRLPARRPSGAGATKKSPRAGKNRRALRYKERATQRQPAGSRKKADPSSFVRTRRAGEFPRDDSRSEAADAGDLVFGKMTTGIRAERRKILAQRFLRRARHSSAVISQISVRKRPETYSRSSVATIRIPVFSEMRREPTFTTALGARSTGNFNTSNQ